MLQHKMVWPSYRPNLSKHHHMFLAIRIGCRISNVDNWPDPAQIEALGAGSNGPNGFKRRPKVHTGVDPDLGSQVSWALNGHI